MDLNEILNLSKPLKIKRLINKLDVTNKFKILIINNYKTQLYPY